jgi:hypothetical protein
MIKIRKAADRGAADHGWLDTRYTFSFSDYYDPAHMGFRVLRVMNEDVVAAGAGFPMHAHKDMEIVTFILEGALEHKDSMGNGEVLRPGEIQRMSAGTGIRHSEFNPSPTEPVHLYQIWILPDRAGHTPSYEQISISAERRNGQLCLAASPDGLDGSVRIHQDASIYWTNLSAGQVVTQEMKPGRHAWIQVLKGSAAVNGVGLETGDGVAVSDEIRLELRTSDSETAELLVFDMP